MHGTVAGASTYRCQPRVGADAGAADAVRLAAQAAAPIHQVAADRDSLPVGPKPRGRPTSIRRRTTWASSGDRADRPRRARRSCGAVSVEERHTATRPADESDTATRSSVRHKGILSRDEVLHGGDDVMTRSGGTGAFDDMAGAHSPGGRDMAGTAAIWRSGGGSPGLMGSFARLGSDTELNLAPTRSASLQGLGKLSEVDVEDPAGCSTYVRGQISTNRKD